jgi:DNA-binding MarR family transcriptional regulator
VAGHRVTDEISTRLKVFGATEPQCNVLRIFRGAKNKPLSVLEISERMVQRSSNVTRIIDKLVAQNRVVRQECAENRRKMDIVITEEGLAYLKKLDMVVEEYHEGLNGRLNAEEYRQLTTLLNKLFSDENTEDC